jgi:hypothetical protein
MNKEVSLVFIIIKNQFPLNSQNQTLKDSQSKPSTELSSRDNVN